MKNFSILNHYKNKIHNNDLDYYDSQYISNAIPSDVYTKTSSINIEYPGYYIIEASCYFDANITGNRYISLYEDSITPSGININSDSVPGSGFGPSTITLARPYYFNKATKINLYVYQNSGQSLNVQSQIRYIRIKKEI